MALAIYKGYEKIEIAGVEMSSDTEYVRQRPGVFFWIGIAVGRGIEVVLHSPLLMNENDYGYTGEIMITKQQLEMATRKLEEITEEKKTIAFEMKGRCQALLDVMTQTKDPALGARLFQTYLEALNKAQDAMWQYGEFSGKLEENRRYMKQCDDLIVAAGGEKSLQGYDGIA